MKTRGSIKIEIISGDSRYVRIIEGKNPWEFYSDILKVWSRPPIGFVYDQESVPFLKGTNPEAGCGHDLVCRSDFRPPVSKTQGAKIYLELQQYYDAMESSEYPDTKWGKICSLTNILWDKTRRGTKVSVVWIAPGYFQKHKVMATYTEITGKTEPQEEVAP